VHVGAADARVVDGDENIVRRRELGLGALGKGDVVGLVEDEGEVLWARVQSVNRLAIRGYARVVFPN
jgi:hypothetical protein